MKILYIEDNDLLGQCVKDLLEDNGHEVTWFQDRAKIPQIISSYNLVVSDFNVPGGHFDETANMCAKQNIPLLLTSGNPNAKYKNSLPKPFQIEELIASVERLVA